MHSRSPVESRQVTPGTAGLDDFTCNWLGTERWINALHWNGSAGWAAASDSAWHLAAKPDVLAGTARNYGPLSFVKVSGSGHLVPMDQPEAAHDLLTRFISGRGFGRETLPRTSVSY